MEPCSPVASVSAEGHAQDVAHLVPEGRGHEERKGGLYRGPLPQGWDLLRLLSGRRSWHKDKTSDRRSEVLASADKRLGAAGRSKGIEQSWGMAGAAGRM